MQHRGMVKLAGEKSIGRGVRGRGFTLIEVMIVIAIVLALFGIVAYNVFGRKEEADKGTVTIQMKQIQQAMRQFKLTFNRWPTDEEGIEVLWNKDRLTEEADQKKWIKFMEEPQPNDMWGTPWGYRQISEHGDESMYDLWSFGPDKQEGTEDDINSWKAEDEAAPSGTSGGGSTGT